ncbi:hypothetical protein VHEMI01644 [[Torrubiella] hemipterigena]|uniref:Uncharacterized protein n=1 Tax=[Torrubiella] hemipterigena TaxID=1531966 RepID=A0A0A1SMF1_9HYPO|nr:hypothetical protein VHEMI01644 [[Torrubiella] hemipterigena]
MQLLQRLLLLLPLIAASPTNLAPLLLHDESTGGYVVKLKESAAAVADNNVLRLISVEPDYVYTHVLNGFSAKLDERSLHAVRQHPDVEYVEQVTTDYALGFDTSYEKWNDQSGATWGIARTSNKKSGIKTYSYHESAGKGVCAYVVDTGIDDAHPDFGGRAKQIKSFINGSEIDDHGHGTHCAGTVGSKTWGIAKEVTLYGIKVLNSGGRGVGDAVVNGYDYVAVDAPKRNCSGVVVNVSIGGEKAAFKNDAVAALVKKGYFVAVAAGNNGKDANDYSPSSEPSVCTVGAIQDGDSKASFSNYGAIVDIQAPGMSIESTTRKGQNGQMSGTSMACPHVAGQAAVLISQGLAKGPDACDKIKETALKGVVKGLPSGTTADLLFNGNPKAS